MKRGLRRDAINSFIQSLKKHWMWLALGAVVLIAVLILVIVLVLTSSKYLQECLNDQTISKDMVDLVIPANHCNDKELTMLDLSAFKKLKTLSVNGHCFERVQGLTLSGLSHLERVIVGEDSFSKVAGAVHSGVWRTEESLLRGSFFQRIHASDPLFALCSGVPHHRK